jgi:cytochrome c-type biogenesis protein CcmH
MTYDRSRWARLSLILAAVVAVVSVGMSLYRQQRTPPAPIESPDDAMKGKIDQMIAKLAARVKAEPDKVEGWRLLGWSYVQTERYPQAVDAYRHAVALTPRDSELWSALGEVSVLANGGRVSDAALDAFHKALAITPDDPRSRFFLAAAKEEKGDVKGAIDDWVALLKEAPADASWTGPVRQRLEAVAAANKIDLSGRLPPQAPVGSSR